MTRVRFLYGLLRLTIRFSHGSLRFPRQTVYGTSRFLLDSFTTFHDLRGGRSPGDVSGLAFGMGRRILLRERGTQSGTLDGDFWDFRLR